MEYQCNPISVLTQFVIDTCTRCHYQLSCRTRVCVCVRACMHADHACRWSLHVMLNNARCGDVTLRLCVIISIVSHASPRDTRPEGHVYLHISMHLLYIGWFLSIFFGVLAAIYTVVLVWADCPIGVIAAVSVVELFMELPGPYWTGIYNYRTGNLIYGYECDL